MFEGLFDEELDSLTLQTTGSPSSSYKGGQHKSQLLASHEIAQRADSGFVGLLNQGATCYLNSLLQTLYLTPEFRMGLYSVGQEEIGFEREDAGYPPPASPPPAQAGLAEAEDKVHIVDDYSNHGDEGEFVQMDDDTLASLLSMGFNLEQIQLAAKNFAPGASVERLLGFLVGDESSTAAQGAAPSSPWDKDNDYSAFFASDDIVESAKRQAAQAEREALLEEVAAQAPSSPEPTSQDVSGQDQDLAKRPKKKKMIIQLLKLFASLQHLDIEALSTRELTDSFGWSGRQNSEQHDVHELNRILSSAIEDSLKGGSQENLVSSLYGGTFINTINCLRCGNSTGRKEGFVDIPVVVSGFRSLSQSLESLTAAELLQAANQYFCEACNCKVDAERRTAILDLPPILTFSLIRFGFDFQQGRRVKIKSHFEFPLTLDMKGFTHEPSEAGAPEEYELFSVVVHSGDAYGGHYHAIIHATPPGASEPAWYDFNDSKVTKVDPKAIEAQFGGSESAYLLVYRRKPLPDVQQLKIPTYLEDHVRFREAQIEEKRSSYEEAKHLIRIFVDCQSHYQVVDGGIIEENLKPSREIVIDSRKTIFDLKSAILDSHQDQPMPDLLQMRLQSRIGSRADLLFEKGPARLEDSCPIKDSEIKDKENYLCWDGQTINGVFWDGKTRSFELEVQHFHNWNHKAVFAFTLSENCPISEFRRKVAARAQVEPSELALLLISPEGLPFPLELEDLPLGLALKGCGPNKGVFSELKKPTLEEHFIFQRYKGVTGDRSVFVIDKCSGGWHATYKLPYDPKMTLGELKAQVVSLLSESDYGAKIDHHQLRLRRSLIADADGALFMDEGMSLEKAGVEEGSRLIVEQGQVVPRAALPVRYVFHSPARKLLVSRELVTDRAATLFECKIEVANLHSSSPSEIKAYLLNAWEERGDFLRDQDQVPLVELKNDLGHYVLQTEVGLSFYFEEKSQKEETWIFNVDQFFFRIPSLASVSGSGGPSLYHPVPPIRYISTPRNCAAGDSVHLEAFQLPAKSSAADVIQHLFEQSYLLRGLDGETQLRIWLKGAPIPPEKLRVPLRKLQFKNGKRLTLQILEGQDPLPRPGFTKRTVLYFLHRCPEMQEFDGIYEHVLFSGPECSWRQLIDEVAGATGIPSSDLFVAHLDRRRKTTGPGTWQPIDEELTWSEKSYLDNIFAPPYNLVDGDVIGLMQRSDDLCRGDRAKGWQLLSSKKEEEEEEEGASGFIGPLLSPASSVRINRPEPVLRIDVS